MKSKEEIKAVLLKHFQDNFYCKDCRFHPKCGLACHNCRPTNWQMSEDFADKLAGEIIA